MAGVPYGLTATLPADCAYWLCEAACAGATLAYCGCTWAYWLIEPLLPYWLDMAYDGVDGCCTVAYVAAVVWP